jgi:hypothetical protein
MDLNAIMHTFNGRVYLKSGGTVSDPVTTDVTDAETMKYIKCTLCNVVYPITCAIMAETC